MTDKESQILFEAYRKIYEAPVSPGAAADEPDIASKMDKDDISRLAKYKITDHTVINQIKSGVVDYLKQFENSTYPNTYKEFRSDIIDIIRDVAGIGSANAKYAARVTQNAFRRLNVISVDDNGNVVVKDVSGKEDAIEDKIEAGLQGQPAQGPAPIAAAPVKLDLKAEYTVDTLGADQLPKIEQELIEYLEDGRTGEEIMFTLKGTLIFRDSEERGGLDGREIELRKIVNSWVKNGILVQAAADDEDKEIDLGDDSFDSGDDRYAADDYWQKELGGHGLGSGSMNDV